ncbi:hypothetical protein OUZ56_004267 [Daphnia magna]|uniref:Uncharacterized protein n=1 Tax=Daphnia magna TaxID=35525 RepID=A0ABQ9YPF6_9CRUS|nr:hypothetical protein OUZ56_004267 [Daphnia magna]
MRQLHGLMDYSGIITLTHAPSINICTAHAQHSSHRSQRPTDGGLSKRVNRESPLHVSVYFSRLLNEEYHEAYINTIQTPTSFNCLPCGLVGTLTAAFRAAMTVTGATGRQQIVPAGCGRLPHRPHSLSSFPAEYAFMFYDNSCIR